MLVLTRKRDEMITIGTDIVIRVMKTGKGSVKIGIEAPPSVRVLRGEIANAETHESTESITDLITCVDEQFEECTLEALMVQN